MKKMKKSLGQVILCLRKIQVFELQLLFSNFLEDLARKSKITGTSAETVDM